MDKNELAAGIRFAGERAATAGRYCKDWNHQLGHQWTTRDAFSHLAATAGGLAGLYPALDGGALSGIGIEQVAMLNQARITELEDKSNDEILQAIIDGHNASADFVQALDDRDLEKVITLGGYEMPKSEIVAQIFIHHAIAHAYEASARWPIL